MIVISSITLVCFLKVSPIYILICVIAGAIFVSWWNNRKETLGSSDSSDQTGHDRNNSKSKEGEQ